MKIDKEKQEPVGTVVSHEYVESTIFGAHHRIVATDYKGNKLSIGQSLFAAPPDSPDVAYFVDEIKIRDNEIAELRSQKFSRFNNDDCWIYQGDGEDHLESLSCPVVISPEKLISILAETQSLKSELEGERAAALNYRNDAIEAGKKCDGLRDLLEAMYQSFVGYVEGGKDDELMQQVAEAIEQAKGVV